MTGGRRGKERQGRENVMEKRRQGGIWYFRHLIGVLSLLALAGLSLLAPHYNSLINTVNE
jgi:hypothetical protein